MLRVDGEIFESATKKLRIRKYPYTCGQGPNGSRVEDFLGVTKWFKQRSNRTFSKSHLLATFNIIIVKWSPYKKVALAGVHVVSAIVSKDFSMGIGA